MKHGYLALALLMVLGRTASAQTVQKCCGTANSTFLLGNLGTASHSQCIYTPGDLTNESDGDITTLYYRYGTTGIDNGNTLTNFMVRLTQTSQTSFPGGNTFFTGLQTVLTSASFTIPPGASGEWFAIPLDDTFNYDASLTLIVDLSFTGSVTTNFGTMSTSMAGRKLYWSDVVSPTGESVVSSWQDIGFDLAVGTDIAEFSTPAFSIHPNPASDEVKLLRNPALQGSVTLNVIDAAGRIVLVRTLSAGGASEVVRTDGLPNGLYELQVIAADGRRVTQRLAIAR